MANTPLVLTDVRDGRLRDRSQAPRAPKVLGKSTLTRLRELAEADPQLNRPRLLELLRRVQ